MVALPFVPGCAKVVVKQTLAGVNVFNVFHVDGGAGSGWSATELGALATAVRNAWVTNVIPLQNSALTLNNVDAFDLASDIGPQASAVGSTVGTLAGSALPANAAICWSWTISRRYRGGHPRTYIGGLGTASVLNANTIVATQVTAHTNAAVALRAAINAVTTAAGTARLSTVHYRRNKILLTTPLVSPVNGVVVDSRLDSQRRRLGRDR